VLANSLKFVDSKAVQTDAILDEDEGFIEIVEAEKKVEAKRPTSKFPPGTVSGNVSLSVKSPNPALVCHEVILFMSSQGCI
jgi:hypothetical protein